MNNNNEKKLEIAFETIKEIFQEQLGEEIVSISAVEFITKNKAEIPITEGNNSFKISSDEKGMHSFRAKKCQLIGGHVFCV